MCFEALLWWARQQTTIRYHNVTLTTAYQQVTGGNAMRWALFIPGVGQDTVSYAFAESLPANDMFALAAGGTSSLINENAVGDLIHMPFWMRSTTGGQIVTVTTLSYLPDRKALINEYIRRNISIAGAP